MPGPAPADLDSRSLATRLRELSGEERNVQVDFLLHLDLYDRRRAYLEAGYGRPEMVAVSGSDWSLRVTIDEGMKADLETLRCLLSHKIPDGDLASVLREAVRCGIEKHGRRRGAVAPQRERKASAESAAADVDVGTGRTEGRSRPSARVKREVFARDEGGCAWIGEDGRRCGSRWQLEFDHVQAAALGGAATVAGVRVLCRPHNVLHAEKVFGREFMARFRRESAAPIG